MSPNASTPTTPITTPTRPETACKQPHTAASKAPSIWPIYAAFHFHPRARANSYEQPASDYYSEGRRFESCRAHYEISANTVFAPSNRREGRPVPSVLPLIFFQTASQGACTYDLDVPVLDPVRIHHTTGILQFPVTIDDTLSPILLFLNYCVPTHRKTIRKPFLHYSLRDMGWSGLIGFPCRHSRCRQFDISTSLCPGNSSGGIEHHVPVKEGTGLE